MESDTHDWKGDRQPIPQAKANANSVLIRAN